MSISGYKKRHAVASRPNICAALVTIVVLAVAFSLPCTVPRARAAMLAREGAAPEGSGSLPANPVQQVATKALRGDFGNLKKWQYKAYEYVLAQDADVSGLAWVTSFGPWEGFPLGGACAYGYVCSISTAAANSIPGHYYVLIELPHGWEVRRIEDRGALWNDRLAQRKGADVWIDRWVTRNQGIHISRYASIRAFKTW